MKFQEATDNFHDLVQSLIKLRQKHYQDIQRSVQEKAAHNPTIGEVVSLSGGGNMSSVWDRFQCSISREEMYSDTGTDVTEVLNTIRKLPIVGKKQNDKLYSDLEFV